MASAFVNDQIKSHKIVVFSRTTCPYCMKAKAALKEVGADYIVVEVDTREDGAAIQEALGRLTGARTVCITTVKVWTHDAPLRAIWHRWDWPHPPSVPV